MHVEMCSPIEFEIGCNVKDHFALPFIIIIILFFLLLISFFLCLFFMSLSVGIAAVIKGISCFVN